jgi:sRNA-binding regulator protein Hfq
MLDEHVDLFKTARIQKQIYALAGGQLAARVLGFNALFTTALACHLTALFKHAINIVHRSALPFKPLF